MVQYIVVIGEQRSEPEEPAGIKERPVGSTAPVRLIVSGEVHFPYPHKTTERGQFDRALAEVRTVRSDRTVKTDKTDRTDQADSLSVADEAVMLTSSGHVAECTIWTLFWWEGEKVATPSLELGVLPGVARARLGRLLGGLRERRVGVDELRRQSLFLANAARGVVQVASLNGDPMPPDPRTVRLQESFWP